MWDYVNRRAREHRRERERYEEEVRTQGHNGGGSFSFMRFCGSGGGRNPQPREGRRWLQQALEDLKAALHESTAAPRPMSGPVTCAIRLVFYISPCYKIPFWSFNVEFHKYV